MQHWKVIVCLLIFCSYVQGQEIPKDELASAAFDFQLDRIRSNEHLEALGIHVLREGTFLSDLQHEFGELVEDVDRIRGAYLLDVETDELDAALIEEAEYPLNLFLELTFRDEVSAKDFREFLRKRGRPEKQEDGISYLTPYDASGIKTYLEGKTITVTAGHFGIKNEFESLLNDVVADKWRELPDAPIRGAIDMVGSKKMMVSFKDFLNVELRMMGMGDVTRSIFEAFDDVGSVSGFADLGDEKLFSLTVQAEEEKLERIEGVAKGMLFLVMNGALSQVENLRNVGEPGEDLLRELAKQIEPKKTDEQGIRLEIKKPERFDEILRDDVIPNLSRVLRENVIREKFRSIGFAVRMFERTHGHLPFNLPDDASFTTGLSWRAHVSKGFFISEHAELNLEKAFDSDVNRGYESQMPTYFGLTGSDTDSNVFWVRSNVLQSEDITDGKENTLMIVASGEEAPWLQPDQGLSAEDVVRLVRNLDEGELLYGATYDGKLVTLTNESTEEKLKALLTPAGGDN